MYNAVGYNIANVIMIEGDDGVVIVDTGICLEQGRETGADLQRMTDKPIAGIVSTHHHADHCQGTRAFLTEQQTESGSVPIVAHETPVPEYQHESGLIGPIVSVRAFSMYNLLPDERTLLSAEVIQDHCYPNIYTVRGAKYRDP